MYLSPEQVLSLIPWSEYNFETARSRGPGGQNVNRTNSAVILRFNPLESSAFNEAQKNRLRQKLAGQLTQEGELVIRSEETRSQVQNRDLVLKKLAKTLSLALHTPKKRIATRPTRNSQKKRVESKRIHSETKNLRKKVAP